MTIKAKVEKINPSTAKKWLEELNYEDNRNINEKKVDFLVRQILGKHWIINGATICFDKDGQLLDGQHRLSAISKSKTPCESIVVRGLSIAAYTTIDQGWKRSHAQILGAAGHKWAGTLVGACKFIWILETEHVFIKKRTGEVSIDEVQLVLEFKPEVAAAVALIRTNRLEKLANSSLLAYCAWLFNTVNVEKSTAFFARLADGAGLGTKSPILTLRDKLMRGRREKISWNVKEQFSFVVRAWNAYAQGRTLSILRLKTKGRGGSKEVEVPKVWGWE